jgi:hypothetical protein
VPFFTDSDDVQGTMVPSGRQSGLRVPSYPQKVMSTKKEMEKATELEWNRIA